MLAQSCHGSILPNECLIISKMSKTCRHLRVITLSVNVIQTNSNVVITLAHVCKMGLTHITVILSLVSVSYTFYHVWYAVYNGVYLYIAGAWDPKVSPQSIRIPMNAFPSLPDRIQCLTAVLNLVYYSVQANKHIKDPHHWPCPLWWESIGDRLIPITKKQ